MIKLIRDIWSMMRARWKATLGLLGVLILLGLIVFTVGVTAWEYTNSTQFCGTTCHTMPPEYVAYQQSPHARVSCVDCHLGQKSVLLTIPQKALEVKHVVYALTQDYELPIYIRTLRPARETCEKCHNPEKFSTDSVREIKHYANDEANTEKRIILTLKTGGGAAREGLGKGIHWHIENEVWFYSDDKIKQEIPFLRQIDGDGAVTEFYDLDSDITPEFIAQNEDQLQRMDCTDCHNRISHLFKHPDRLVDDAIARKTINPDIPFIRAWAASILKTEFDSHEEANAKAQDLNEWYQRNYPEYYDENQGLIQQAIDEVIRLYKEAIFPEMEIGWLTHPNNTGHLEFPGCFRCHDGKHTSAESTTIRLECNLCHSIPRTAGVGLPDPLISLSQANEPASHKDSNWLARHRQEFDETCAGCHSTFNRGGDDDSSFCANSACHGTNWKWAGLDAPGLREHLPPPSEESVGNESPTAVDQGDSFVPRIPHPLSEERIGQCLACHGPDGIHPFTPFHVEENFPLDACTDCHDLAPNLQ